ncbi:hypothetical protein D9M70_461430 [compost metagenome]
MSNPMITLGGIPIPPQAGAPDQSSSSLRGEGVVRLSDGAGVKMSHWSKASGSISGTGWVPVGLDGLDYSQPLELLLTKPRSIVRPDISFTLDAACRPDREPWALALVDGRWRSTGCERTDLAVSVEAVPGAARYMVQWMPMYTVLASEPDSSMGSSHGWSIEWEEV